MIDLTHIRYPEELDTPQVSMYLFHPRKEITSEPIPDATDLMIPVSDGEKIGARIFTAGTSKANILFFHGNGEIVSDYDELGPLYNRMGINFLAVDYRGYGRSTGTPTVTAMIKDAHHIFDFVVQWLSDNGHAGPLILMGRSLGSAPVLELAAHYGDKIDGLIIESGFAYAEPLLRLIGVDTSTVGIATAKKLDNIEKIKNFTKPTLVIHAQRDHIIPFSDGEALYEASPAAEKTLLQIPGANHNDILHRGFSEYMAAVKTLAGRVEK